MEEQLKPAQFKRVVRYKFRCPSCNEHLFARRVGEVREMSEKEIQEHRQEHPDSNYDMCPCCGYFFSLPKDLKF